MSEAPRDLEKENATLLAHIAMLNNVIVENNHIMEQQFMLLRHQEKLLAAAGRPLANHSEEENVNLTIGRIHGCTRVLGEDQGYLPLPIRDVIVNLTSGQHEAMDSAWELTEEQRRAVANGVPLILRVFGPAHPPVMLMIGRRLQ